ncbi:otogelin [Megalops cyprinoides]|uniref:otogelin n=1 Tax=Megalops cyprinoides TaxID=118141 RepID=UPI001864058F|nr:otogelin [Megalops cyprinoides]
MKSHYILAGPCTLPCLNGGQCVHPDSCNCSLYQATGVRCQTVVNTGFEREMTCRTWGQYNYETFDGLYYHFPGKCSYTLVRDCEDNSQSSVMIQVHNDPDCRSSPYTCDRSVSLFLPWEGEVRLQKHNVTFKGQSIQLPHNIHDVEMEQISQYVLVTQQHGFTLAWDGHTGSVYIKMSPEYVGRTCGLCGNFNADVQDDLRTSYGLFTQDLAMFGNSWTEVEPQQARCPMVPSQYPSPCSTQDPHTMLKVREVCATLLEEPFKECHEFVSPQSYMASCSNDLCLSGPNGDVVCQVLTQYARACAHAEHPLHDWRAHIPQCAMECPTDLLFRECITCCPASCNVDRMCIDSKLQCLDGCYCPEDLIYESGSCVKASDCPCEYHGMVYPSGQMVQEECNNCTCMGGVWNCTEHSCPGECSVTGDINFQTFDGRVYTFPATCQYVLAKSRSSGRFTVTIQNAPCGPNLDGACIQSVNLIVDEDPKTEITMSHSGEVFISSQYRISLPYSDEVFHIQELSSMFLQVRTVQGLRLQYNWREFRLYLQVEASWKEDTVGLCGTFNGNIQDDFLSPSGMIESTPQLFGNSWKLSSACVPGPSVPQLDPCDTHQQAASYAAEMCDILNQELFAPCHEYLSPAPFHRQCRADTCKCGQPCLCSALAHYARQCRKYAIIVEFRARVIECAAQCPETMEYGTCVSSCQRRCPLLAIPQHCGEECEEGCVCPPGTFYSSRTQTCVHRGECPCSFLGAEYAPGDVIMSSSGVQVCQDGKIVPQSSIIDKMCPPGQYYVDCGDPDDGLSLGRGLACEQTCESYLLNLTCSAHEPCVPGCACPPGLLKHGDECFEPVACPCLWKGKEYYPGDKVTSPCHRCVCQHGSFQCVFRPCPSMCTAYGDRHYRTFDGLLFDYVGVCKVYLVKSSADVMMSVTAENVDCYDSGIICRKSLLITIGKSVIAFDDDSGRPNPSSLIDRTKTTLIWQAGYFTILHVPEEDFTVLWDRKTTVHIQAGPRWQGKLTGLCGNFDMKTVNEMRTPENIDSPTPQEFGNSWTAAECVNSPDIRHPCSLNPLREPFAKRRCGILLSEVFQICHPVVDVTWFYMNCLMDTCGCSRGGDCECFCTGVSAYAHRCCQEGVTVDWRSPAMCPYDCEFYNKVLGKGPFKLVTYRDRDTVLAANTSGGFVFPLKGALSAIGVTAHFMMTPGLSRSRPHDTSLVSFEAAERPNYFVLVGRSGHLELTKWQEGALFQDQSTFILHRDTWISGFDSLESFALPGFFLHYTRSRLQLMKYNHSDGFRRATLFRLTGPESGTYMGPRCQWRYESCASACYRTCSDPSGQSCTTIPKVEGCLPQCPSHMILDEVTQRCVYVEDCIKPPVAVQPTAPLSTVPAPAAVTSAAVPATAAISTARFTTPTASPPAPSPETTSTTAAAAMSISTSRAVVSTTIIAPTEVTSTATPRLPTTLRTTLKSTVAPEVPESVTTGRTSAASPTISLEVTATTPRSPYVPIVPVTERTSPAPPTAPFWLTTTVRPGVTSELTSSTTAILPPSPTVGISTTSIEAPVRTSTLPVVPGLPTERTTKATSSTAKVSPVYITATTRPAVVSETSRLSTISAETLTTVYKETTTEPTTVETVKTTKPPIPDTKSTPPVETSSTATTAYTPSPSTPMHTLMVTTPEVSPTQSTESTTTVTTTAVDWRRTTVETRATTSETTTTSPVSPKLTHTTSKPPETPSPTVESPHTTATTPIPASTKPATATSMFVTSTPPLPPVSPTETTPEKNHRCSTSDGEGGGVRGDNRAGDNSIVRAHITTHNLKQWANAHVSESHSKSHIHHSSGPNHQVNCCNDTKEDHKGHRVHTCPTCDFHQANHGQDIHWEGLCLFTNKTPSGVNSNHISSLPNKPHESRFRHYLYHTSTDRATLTSSPVLPPLPITTVETAATSAPVTTPSPYTTAPERWWTTTAEVATPSLSPHVTSEIATSPESPLTTEVTTTTAAPSTRMCTPPYSEIIDECTKYICVGGQLVLFNKSQNCPYNSTPPNCGLLGFAVLVNGDKCCPQWDCPCRCSVFPDLNIITFDGNSVAIYKAASYIVTQLPNETVSIQVQECQASDTLLWNFTNLCLVALNITYKSNQVLINRLQRRLYVNARYAKPRFKKYGFEVLDTGNMYLIRTPAGLKIQWFHSTGMMVIEMDGYNNKLSTMGLCGCCDGNPANDLTLSNGTTVSEGEDPALFIDSWQVPNTTGYISHSRRREVNCSTSDCSECLDMLSNHTFSACHLFVPPTMFCEVWVRDAEYVKNPCVALAAYVASCHKFNICIEWRSPDYCPFMCPDELRYQACLPACTAQTCPNHEFDSDPEECSGLTEGCVCPEGTLLHRPYSALCIPSNKCACTDSFGNPRASGEVWKASVDGCCMYKCDNDTIIPVEYNCSDVPQPICKRRGEVTVSLADDKSCCPQKACVCNQTLCGTYPPECNYGEKLVSYFREDSCCPDYICECDPDQCELDVPTCRDDQTLIATRADGSCCLAHICMCGACSDVVPECQEGEVLTVDANSTDRCCPAYHCVCEPYRCADFTCPLGMSVVSVSVPGQCCPLRTCECACEKIVRPQCELGETVQIDRTFSADPQNQCGCKKYICERDPVCVDGERGVMRPGQTLVEHSVEGVCYTTQCTRTLDPLTGYFRIRATSTNCTAQCQPNQIYIPPKDHTTCCGACKNISCMYENENGSITLYKPGKTWVSNCIKYECTDTLSGPTLVSYSFSCPPFNETECIKIGGTVVSYMDGCCRTCKEDGKSCQKVTVRMTIRKNDCRSNRPVNIVSCDGKCPSASIYNYNINTYARFCKCCREMGLQRRTVQLYCSGNSTWVNYSIQEPTDCSCQWS